jgi:hypothetical protein
VFSLSSGGWSLLAYSRVFVTVPRIVPTPCTSRAFHGRADRFRLRMNISARRGKIAVPRQVRQGERVHVLRPTRQAGVPERV